MQKGTQSTSICRVGFKPRPCRFLLTGGMLKLIFTIRIKTWLSKLKMLFEHLQFAQEQFAGTFLNKNRNVFIQILLSGFYRTKVFSLFSLKLKREKEEKKKVVENYTSERAMRKKYYNMVEEMKGTQTLPTCNRFFSVRTRLL